MSIHPLQLMNNNSLTMNRKEHENEKTVSSSIMYS